ncbi:hypothetical protein AYO38_02670 [bacterium SCGC AG-212-C10]|nr:hypothetical protein AYO38_02670 [bacterium SCGC AG-212-C10]
MNQDALAIQTVTVPTSHHSWTCAALADGMGGVPGGDVASGLAVTTALAHLSATRKLPSAAPLEEAFDIAHQAVVAEAELTGLRGMGTTLIVLVAAAGVAYLGSVGDCRAHLISGAGSVALTRDHTVAASGDLEGWDPGEIARSPFAGMLTRAIGIGGSPPGVDIVGPISVGDGDRIVLTSDGVHDVVQAGQIFAIGGSGVCDSAAEALVAAAGAAGTQDDATAIVIEYRVQGSA